LAGLSPDAVATALIEKGYRLTFAPPHHTGPVDRSLG
jgi:hypothetical protein